MYNEVGLHCTHICMIKLLNFNWMTDECTRVITKDGQFPGI